MYYNVVIIKCNLSNQHRTNILYLVEKYQTVIIVGETGCGKSTQVLGGMVREGGRLEKCEPL